MLSEIRNYIEYFPKNFSENEVEGIVNLLIQVQKESRRLSEESAKRKVRKEAVSRKKIYFKNEKVYYTQENGEVREITGLVVSVLIGIFVGIFWSILALSIIPLFILPLVGCGIGFFIDLVIEDKRKTKRH